MVYLSMGTAHPPFFMSNMTLLIYSLSTYAFLDESEIQICDFYDIDFFKQLIGHSSPVWKNSKRKINIPLHN